MSNDKWLTWWPRAWQEKGWKFRDKDVWQKPVAGLTGGDTSVAILVSQVDDPSEQPPQMTTRPTSVL